MADKVVSLDAARTRRRQRARPKPPERLAQITIEGRTTIAINAPYSVVSEQVRAAWADGGDVLLPVEGKRKRERFEGSKILSVRERRPAQDEVKLTKAA